jgi:hypothetical protein
VSILLESLNQKVDKTELHQLPDVHSSHFDDEMLGDEVLYKQLKLWKLISLILSLLILLSWGYFYQQKSQPQPQSNQLLVAEQPIVDKVSTQNLDEENINSTVEKEPVTQAKSIYKPQKREVISVKPTLKVGQPEPMATRTKPKATGAAIDINELPSALQQNFPQIEIASYVIADNAEDSFVILDGSFYKINQVITTDLTLRKITNEHIVVEFQAYLVKIPLK